uniref:Uncharacterized protein n=1 Tax=Arundo donax TaxID=35708 RepID=A0A0A9FCW5_ARUDO
MLLMQPHLSSHILSPYLRQPEMNINAAVASSVPRFLSATTNW